MPVGSSVLPAGYMDPIVLPIAGLHDELIKVGIVLQPIKPLAGGL